MHHDPTPYTGIPSPILLGIVAAFAILYGVAALRERRTKQ